MITVIKRRRGFFGWVFLLLFLLFYVAMALWVAGAWRVSSDMASSTTDHAEQAGIAIGGFIAGAALLWIWFFGAVITGLLAFLTRSGKTVMIERNR
jgi:hypothetical protein